MSWKVKLYAIYKNGKHVGNAEASTPKMAIWCYCRTAHITANYTIYKAVKAIQGRHYLRKTEINLDKCKS